MSTINKDVLGRCLFESTLKEIREIEAMDYSFIRADDDFKERILNASRDSAKKDRSYPKRIALILVATLAICFFIMFAVSAQIRTTVIDFFVEIYESFSTLFIQGDDNTENPKSIETEYTSTYFRKNGYEQTNEIKTKYNILKIWENGNLEVDFSQHIINGNEVTIDANEASYQITYLGEHKIYYMLKNNIYFVKWLAYGYSFNLNCDEGLGWEEIEKIVLSLEPVSE